MEGRESNSDLLAVIATNGDGILDFPVSQWENVGEGVSLPSVFHFQMNY